MALVNISALTKALLPERAKNVLRDIFYLYLPIKRKVFHIIASLVPPFVPIEGYLLDYMPHSGETVIDAGPYPGNFTIILSRLVGRNGTVLAFEANKNNYHELLMRIRRLRLKNIIVLNVALWNSDGEFIFMISNGEGSSLSRRGNARPGSDPVRTKKLDTIINELGIRRVNYMKMDIEGAEIEAIKGAAGVLSVHCPEVVIASYHVRDGVPTHKAVSEALQASGYQVKVGFPAHLTVYGVKNKNPG
jgi:FkbM family methyltransferase